MSVYKAYTHGYETESFMISWPTNSQNPDHTATNGNMGDMLKKIDDANDVEYEERVSLDVGKKKMKVMRIIK